MNTLSKILTQRNLMIAIFVTAAAIFLWPERAVSKTNSELCKKIEHCLYDLGTSGYIMDYTPDGQLYSSGPIRWSSQDNYKPKNLKTKHAVTPASDGRYALSRKGVVTIYSAEDEELLEFSTESKGINIVRDATFIDSIHMLAIPRYVRDDDESFLSLWSTKTGDFVTQLPHDNYIDTLTVSSNDLIAVGQGNGKIVLWPAQDFSGFRTLEASTETITELSFSASGELLASADKLGEIKLWNVTTGEQLLSIKEKEDLVGLSLSKSADLLLAAYSAERSGTVLAWKLSTEANTSSAELIKQWSYPERVYNMTLSPSEAELAVALAERTETRKRQVRQPQTATSQTRYKTEEYTAVLSPEAIIITDLSKQLASNESTSQ